MWEYFGLVWLSTVIKQLAVFHTLVRWIVACTVCLLDKLNVAWICLKVTVRNWTSRCDRTVSVVSQSIYFCITLHVCVKVSLYISYSSCIFITVYVFNIYTLLIISRFNAVLSSLSVKCPRDIDLLYSFEQSTKMFDLNSMFILNPTAIDTPEARG